MQRRFVPFRIAPHSRIHVRAVLAECLLTRSNSIRLTAAIGGGQR